MRFGAETKETSILFFLESKQTNKCGRKSSGELECFKRIWSIWKMNVAVAFINEKSFANYAEQQGGRAVSTRLHTDGAAAELI